MAKIYGNRYENLNRPMGGGAQGDVLRVRDTWADSKTEYALKRLKRADRCARFRVEIEALRKIDHPNVIKIVDHSGEPAPGDVNHKYWFVMPIAQANLEERVGMYKRNLDGVLRVSMQLVDALIAAHALGIVHRDVKPANILFPRLDNDVWLSDFGICHIAAAKERLTDEGEVVGPRGFTAPELETGGPVQVSVAADLYSLGKVIYYMLSGGHFIARENLEAPEYLAVFEKSQRHGLLRNLLSRMIAPLDRRIKTAVEVREELQRIVQWEEHARGLALSAAALESIDIMQQRAITQVRIQTENEKIAKSEKNIIEAVSGGVLAWIRGEMEKTASLLKQGGTHITEIGKASWSTNKYFGFGGDRGEAYHEVDGIQLALINTTATFKPKFILKFFVCTASRMVVQTGNAVKPIKASDPQLAVVPYIVELHEPEYTKWLLGGFLKSKAALDTAQADFARRTGGRNVSGHEPLIAATFVGSPINLLVKFKASEWPGILDQVRELFSESVRIFVEFAMSETRSTGP